MVSEKPHLNLIFIGHIDHGKSTSVGRLLYETKAVIRIYEKNHSFIAKRVVM